MTVEELALGSQDNTEELGGLGDSDAGDSVEETSEQENSTEEGKGGTDTSSSDDSDQQEGGASDESGDEEGQAQVAPEKYEAFNVEEGYEVSTERLAEFEQLAKEANLTQDQAQKFVDLQVAQEKATEQMILDQGKQWLEETKAHYGDKYSERLGVAQKGLEYMFGDDTKSVTDILKMTKLANNLPFIKAFEKIGEHVSEGKFVPGSQGQKTKKNAAQTIYPDKE